MPVTLSQIAHNSAKVTLQIQSGDKVHDLNIEYYPGHITEEIFAHIKQVDALGASDDVLESFKALNEILVKLLKSWDLYQDEAEKVMYPVDDVEALKKLPIILRMSVLQGILGHIRPNPEAPQKMKN